MILFETWAITGHIIINDNNNDNNIIKSKIITNDNNKIKRNITTRDNNNDNTNNKSNIIISNDINDINKYFKNNFNTNENNNTRKINTFIYDNNNFNNNIVVSINCNKRIHHVSAKSIDAINFNATVSNFYSNNKNRIENKSNKGRPYRTKRLKEMEKNILLSAPKKECNVCHKFIESHLFKIHANNHPSQIFNWMYLGTFESACDPSELRKLGINYILNCAYDCKNTQLPKDITELHLKVRDESDFEIFEYFEKANTFINKVRAKGGIILIHCKLGISRSPSFVLAYLMKYYNFSLQTALKFVRKRRPQINPNEGFMNHLDKYEKLFKRKERKIINDANPSIKWSNYIL